MNGGLIEVYCDGSVTNAIMLDVVTSELGSDYIGRAMVVIPALDFGLIEQTRAGMVTELGMPRSSEAEAFAVRTALKVCTDLGLANYMVFSDCQGVVEQLKNNRVEWRSREQMYLPNSVFDKVLGRASYVRQSSKTVVKRKPAQPHNVEAFELFNAPRREFKLSASALWARVTRDAQKHEQALGLSAKT
jgi:ribonuclease HI